jgi:exopolysaccharide biosynthesis polyprenyl glycosylphosphotransferase
MYKVFRVKYSKANSKAASGPSWTARPRQPEIPHASIRGSQARIKRLIDVCGSVAGLIFLSPLLFAIAAAVKISDGGSILYKQTRLGLNGRPFRIMKFRSMHPAAERDLGPVWSVPQDPRCTRLGGLLRRLGFDELPQLWNVLKGDMSLVGPRPERPEFVSEFRGEFPIYDVRHSVRSGITGYAQVHGWRGDTSVEMRLQHDLYYIENWSVSLDIRVLLLTVMHGWSERTRDGLN